VTTVLFPGDAEGALLALTAPLSFWGGVSPATGTIVDPRHPQRGASIAERILVVPEPIGSSSSSAVLLELIRVGRAPAGLVLGRADAILVVGCLAARELGWLAPPVLLMPNCAALSAGRARIAQDRLTLLDGQRSDTSV
jgi:predicted aconitase with swiveling domain